MGGTKCIIDVNVPQFGERSAKLVQSGLISLHLERDERMHIVNGYKLCCLVHPLLILLLQYGSASFPKESLLLENKR
jgi:hypothetical protein